MYYGRIKYHDVANGEGVRVSLFVSGCRNHCDGCFNPETWNFLYGKPFTTKELGKIIDALTPDYISGLTILGGDPFEPENIECVTDICMMIKSYKPDKTIWVYTGYSYEQFADNLIMNYIDVLVDGKYIEAEKDIALKFRGSRNQRIIDIPKTHESRSIVLWEG